MAMLDCHASDAAAQCASEEIALADAAAARPPRVEGFERAVEKQVRRTHGVSGHAAGRVKEGRRTAPAFGRP